MATIRLENVTKRFGAVTAVRGMNLEVRDGEFFCLLGPPGAGKTTTLRLIVGLAVPEEGQIYIDNQPMAGVHPGNRDVAMMFQNLALYPDKTVFDNMAYPLRERKMPKDEIDKTVRSVARILYIDHLLERKPAKLSGGERQRVALGRTMVRKPRATLMDEPLANLDALLRLEMRVELKRLQQESNQTLVYVTHDQVEAMSMADRVAVLNRGVVQQVDTPDRTYTFPANRFVATVVGSPPTNFLEAQVNRSGGSIRIEHPLFTMTGKGEGHPVGQALARDGVLPDDVLVGVRPEDVEVLTGNGCADCIPAVVSVIEPLGSEIIVDFFLGDHLIKAVIPPAKHVAEGAQVWLRLNPERIHLFDTRTEERVYTTGLAAELDVKGTR
jgi:multiple sugar transport system ATP-binding protein